MKTIRVFDPAMCCSTGVCGPSVDPRLARFAADLDWVKSQGISVERFNLSQEPQAFADDADVRSALEASGEQALPLVKVDGDVKSHGTYPSRDDLASWGGLGERVPSLYTDAVAELVALGAAVASNCESCFRFHYDKARKLGVSKDDMHKAVSTAQAVKTAPAQAMLRLADRYLSEDEGAAATAAAEPASDAAEESGCCGASATADAGQAPSDCC